MKNLIYILTVLTFFGCGSSHTDFNKTDWNSDKQGRYKMVKDLIESEILIKKKRVEVIQYLGKDYKVLGSNIIIYEINKPKNWISIDHYVLAIDFDHQDKVIEVYETLY